MTCEIPQQKQIIACSRKKQIFQVCYFASLFCNKKRLSRTSSWHRRGSHISTNTVGCSEPIVRLLAKEKPPVERIVFWWTSCWRYVLLGVMIRDIAKNFKYVLGMEKVIW